MHVKIGDDWHEAAPGRPIFLSLTDEEMGVLKESPVNQMGVVHRDDPMTEEERVR